MGEVDESHIAFWEVQFSNFQKIPVFRIRLGCYCYYCGQGVFHTTWWHVSPITLSWWDGEGGGAHRLILHQGAINIVMPALPLCLVFLVQIFNLIASTIRSGTPLQGQALEIVFNISDRAELACRWHNLKQNNVKAIYEATRFF